MSMRLNGPRASEAKRATRTERGRGPRECACRGVRGAKPLGKEMSLAEGQHVELTIEKPASGGRMLARHLGQVVLVRGAILGERVRAWIERAEKRMAYAVTREVLEPSPDRRDSGGDPLCG